MAFKETDKLKAMAIVNIFETSKPFGDYSAFTVLDDGAGISYGANQFTHKSGSLAAVIDRYLKLGGTVGRSTLEERTVLLRKRTRAAIESLAADEIFKNALRSAAYTDKMRTAQNEIAFELYLKPAIDVCEMKGFLLPLSLAVVYDSMTHGSWEKISQRVRGGASNQVLDNLSERKSISAHQAAKPQDEKGWITEYVRQRDEWLANTPRLRKTRYRTKFFLKQIMIGRWKLELPLNVNGVKLTDEAFGIAKPVQQYLPGITASDFQKDFILPATTASDDPPAILPDPPDTSRPQTRAVPADSVGSDNGREAEELTDGTNCLDQVEEQVNAAAAKYDQAERIVKTVIARNDSAKSLWTTVVGTIWQTVWGVAGFLSGMPRVVWLVVAVIAGVLMIGYLYRQIALGRIREKSAAQEKRKNSS